MGAEPSPVGENTARDAALHGDDHAARHAARHRLRVERTHKDLRERLRDRRYIGKENDEADQHVHDDHERHHRFRNFGNAPDPAQQNERHRHRQKNARNDDGKVVLPSEQREDGRLRKDAVHGGSDGIDLRKSADPEQSDAHSEDRKDDRKEFPAPAQSVFNIIKGAAQRVSVRMDDAVLDGEEPFRVFGRHAEKGGQPHPEQRTRPARGDRRGDADNVSRADRRRKRRAERPEAGNLPFPLFLFEHISECSSELAHGKKEQAHGEIDPRAEDEDDERDPPHKIVHRFYDRIKTHLSFFAKKSRPAATAEIRSVLLPERSPLFFAAYTFGALFLASPEFKFYLLYRKKARSVNQNAPAAAYFHIFAQPSIFFISENTLLSIREICTCDTPITSATSLCVMSRKYRKTMILRSRSGSSASAVFNCR